MRGFEQEAGPLEGGTTSVAPWTYTGILVRGSSAINNYGLSRPNGAFVTRWKLDSTRDTCCPKLSLYTCKQLFLSGGVFFLTTKSLAIKYLTQLVFA